MNEKVKTLIDELAAEFNFTPEYLISLCKATSENVYKKDFNDFMNNLIEIDEDEDSIREFLLLLANGGMLKELISLNTVESAGLFKNNLDEK